MNEQYAIEIEGLGKRYQLGQTVDFSRTFREALVALPNAVKRILGKRPAPAGEGVDPETPPGTFWAVRDISFNVKQGETIGIIGHNGAGKSTLLKLLSRITSPTKGRAVMRGRLSSLLEVGTGFHPELTGRENAYLNGAILGMSKQEIDAKFDEIVAFAEIDKFVDTPVKRYSSGMLVRLGFAVAAHLEPEVLIVDEVLSVGDASFQRKCLGKMGDVARAGRTVLFVSHNMVAVQNLCSRVVWIDHGQVKEDGPADQVVTNYLKSSVTDLTQRQWSPEEAPGNDKVRILGGSVRPKGGTPNDPIDMTQAIEVEIRWRVPRSQLPLSAAFRLFDHQGVCLFGTMHQRGATSSNDLMSSGDYVSRCEIPGHLLNSGQFRIQLQMWELESRVAFAMEDFLAFEVLDDHAGRSGYLGKRAGLFRLDLDWTMTSGRENSTGRGSEQ